MQQSTPGMPSIPTGFAWGTATSAFQIEGGALRRRQGRVHLGPLHPHAGGNL
jgi:beta-glucosidase/6-phospho-beta-glucosidase/beta-galactosidase